MCIIVQHHLYPNSYMHVCLCLQLNIHPKGLVLLKFASIGKFHTKSLLGPPLLVVCVIPSDIPYKTED